MLKQSNQDIEREVYQNRVMKSFINVFFLHLFTYTVVQHKRGVISQAGTSNPTGVHLSAFSGVRVTNRPLVFCVVFCRKSFVLLSFDHYVVCSSIYGL